MALTAVPDPKPTRPWVAHKFGGTSVADADRIAAVARLLIGRADAERQVVVVSAMKGTTDALLDLAARAAARDPAWRERAEVLARRHREAADALLGSRETALHAEIEAEFTGLGELLHAMALLGTAPRAAADFVAGLGEVLAAKLLTAYLRHLGRDALMLDAREVLVVRHGELGAAVEWPETERRLADWRAHHPSDLIVVTGFIARDRDGQATTLGRNGSDYSGAIFGALFGAATIEIWTDVDGVLSADPRLVPEAELVPELTYAEACELAYFGAKVIHPQTMQPAIARGIPIRIRNTFNPAHPGSLIQASASREPPVKGVTAIGGLAIVSVEGTGMIGVPGTAERVFSALHRAGISVVMISQGSSEHSICCAVAERDARRAVEELREAFARELERGQIEAVTMEPGVGVLAIVGEGMAGTPGIAARLFGALAHAGINVRAIAQGASERNISAAIAERDVPRALRAVHAAFWLSALTVSVGLVGPGLVGSALLAQLAAAAPRLRASANLDLRVRAIANSRHLLTDERALDLADWKAALERAPAGDLDAFAAHVAAPHLPHAVIIDCSASSAVADRYAEWLRAGIHVITPNKHAGAGPRARYAAIRDAQRARGARFRYEATVGAGLPVISTLRDLVDTGDEILAVEGIFSGTLAYLFNRYDGREPFSALVADARARGYTEPDPRDDLSGIDVGRKLTILAREIGMDLELDEVAIESLVPVALAGIGKDEFLARLAELDAPMAARLDAARAAGQVLRYVARLDVAAGRASVGLVTLPADHAFAHIRLTDNVVQFTTRRYRDNPLVVQGPGAGPDVTAAGVFADLLRVAAALGARV
jgi:aspartokinase/homoserine dehydrogenase 1